MARAANCGAPIPTSVSSPFAVCSADWSLAQRTIRFATYHVLIAAPRHDEHASIGAKTLSGPGYKGHVFWDTELFMLPMLIVTQPRRGGI